MIKRFCTENYTKIIRIFEKMLVLRSISVPDAPSNNLTNRQVADSNPSLRFVFFFFETKKYTKVQFLSNIKTKSVLLVFSAILSTPTLPILGLLLQTAVFCHLIMLRALVPCSKRKCDFNVVMQQTSRVRFSAVLFIFFVSTGFRRRLHSTEKKTWF